MDFHDWLTNLKHFHVFRDTTAKKYVFSQTFSPALARSRTLPQATSIRSGPEGTQGVLGCAAFSLSFSFSSISLSSIFDLIVFPAPYGRVPLQAFSLLFPIFLMMFLSFLSLFTSSFDHCFDDGSSFGYPFFDHDFCICFSSIWGWTFGITFDAC